MPEWITQAGIGVVVLWLVVERMVPRIFDFAKGGGGNARNPQIDRNTMKIETHERDIQRIEAKLDQQNVLLTEMNGNIIALQTLMGELRK